MREDDLRDYIQRQMTGTTPVGWTKQELLDLSGIGAQRLANFLNDERLAGRLVVQHKTGTRSDGRRVRRMTPVYHFLATPDTFQEDDDGA